MVRVSRYQPPQVSDNHAWIDFDGPPGTYRTYSMADVLAGTVPASAFAGKIVLVGVTAPIGKDVFTTSASSKPMSGVEVQANSIETVLRGFPLQSSNPILGVALIIALALAPGIAEPAGELFARRIVVHRARCPIPRRGRARLRSWTHPAGARTRSSGLGLATGGVIAVENLIERRKHRALQAFLEPFLRPGDNALLLVLPARPEQLRGSKPAIGPGGSLRRQVRVHGRDDHRSRSGVAAEDPRGDPRAAASCSSSSAVLARGAGRGIGLAAARQSRRLGTAGSREGPGPPGSSRRPGPRRRSDHAGQRRSAPESATL